MDMTEVQKVIIEVLSSNIIVAIAIIAILEAIKQLGVESKFLLTISVVLGLVANVAVQGIGVDPIATGIVVGYGASKIYDTAREKGFIFPKKEEPPSDKDVAA